MYYILNEIFLYSTQDNAVYFNDLLKRKTWSGFVTVKCLSLLSFANFSVHWAGNL